MADTLAKCATIPESTSHIPIAQLTPFLVAPSTRSVRAIVTLTWPYSSATDSVAFLLAEPDFRLRRTRGQVRAQFSGSSAKAVSKSGIASGDEVILSLDGVAWAQDQAPYATPGRGIEFELRFTERLLLQFRQEDSGETNVIDIDHPTPDNEAPSQDILPSLQAVSSQNQAADAGPISARASPSIDNSDEWSSPAFIKRARTSYGSLFDKDYDIFAEEDGTVPGKGRKRTRLSSTWRYESRSPSREVEQERSKVTSSEAEVRPKPMMADEGSQTIGLEEGDAAEVLAGFHKQLSNVENDSYSAPNGAKVLGTQSRVPAAALDEPSGLGLRSIHTRLDSHNEKMSDYHTRYAVFAQNAPSSPRLQPVPSDALPLVSPLITNRSGAFLGMGPTEAMTKASNINTEVSNSAEDLTQSRGDDAPEDLYGASPTTIHGQAFVNENNFQSGLVGLNSSDEASNIQSHFLSEDQYADWQSMHAQQVHSVSPQNIEKHVVMKEQQSDIFEQDHEEEHNYQAGDLSTSEIGENFQQYPDPDNMYYSEEISSSWGPRSEPTAYPDLPEAEGGLSTEHVLQPALNPRMVAMSRSGSAQSAPVDLTESSDEAGAGKEEEEDASDEDLVDKIDDERLSIEENVVQSERIFGRPRGYKTFADEFSENGEADSMDEESLRDHRLKYGARIERGGASQHSDEEVPYDHQIYEEGSMEDDEPGQGYQEGFGTEQEDSFEEFDEEEDEGSYDEAVEMANEPQVQREPVVIDLLSSDDEDGSEQDLVDPEPATSQRPTDNESPRSMRSEPQESSMDMEAEAGVLIAQHPLSDQIVDDDEHENLGNEAEDMVKAHQGNELSDVENEDKHEEGLKDAAVVDRDDFGEMMASHQDLEIVANEVLEDEEDNEVVDEVGTVQEDEVVQGVEASEDVGLERYREEGSHERYALQDVDESLDAQNSKEERRDTDVSDLKTSSQKSSADGSTRPSSFFARMFNLDGANDERLPSLYPKIPQIEDGPAVIESLSSEWSQQGVAPINTASRKQTNSQLPTPTNTQVSLTKTPSDASSSSLTNRTQMLQNASNQAVLDPTMEKAFQLSRVIDTAAADNAIVHSETEVLVTETIDEEKTKISMKDHSSGKTDAEKEEKVAVEVHNTRSRTRQQNSIEPFADEEAHIIEEAVRSSPRRSHRRGKSTSSTIETPPIKVSTTPSKSASKTWQDEPASGHTDRSWSILLDGRTTPKGQDASVELAIAALESPVKQPHDLRSNQPKLDMKLKLTRALRTELSEFTSLKVLKFKLTQKLDVLGVVATSPPEPVRAKAGPRHYQITFNITDHSIAPGGPHVIEVQVFRPYEDALPSVKVGDGILLREFQVIAVKKGGGFALRSTESSSWAAFREDDDEAVEVRGPPVEFGTGERKQLALLRSWFDDLDSAAMEKIHRATGYKGMAGAGKSIRKVV